MPPLYRSAAAVDGSRLRAGRGTEETWGEAKMALNRFPSCGCGPRKRVAFLGTVFWGDCFWEVRFWEVRFWEVRFGRFCFWRGSAF
jgi:hypothetical protein